MKWWRQSVTLRPRRSCKDHLHPCAVPVVPRVGFDPTSPRFRRGAFTRLASSANWRGRWELNPGRLSGAQTLDRRATSANGGQRRSRTATGYAGRLQRLGLANAQSARDWLQGLDLNQRFMGMSHVRGLITAPITLRRWREARARSRIAGTSVVDRIWRTARESNPRPCGRPGFRDRLRAAAHHHPYSPLGGDRACAIADLATPRARRPNRDSRATSRAESSAGSTASPP
jgi:hypothetical protein